MDVELAEVDTDTPVATRRVPHARVRRLYVVASSVIALHVAAVTWLSAGGGLYIDDIRAQAYAAGRPFYPRGMPPAPLGMEAFHPRGVGALVALVAVGSVEPE